MEPFFRHKQYSIFRVVAVKCPRIDCLGKEVESIHPWFNRRFWAILGSRVLGNFSAIFWYFVCIGMLIATRAYIISRLGNKTGTNWKQNESMVLTTSEIRL
jgi:hypothetical protein